MPCTENKNRYLLAAAVAGLHVALVIAFIVTQSLAVHPYAGPVAAMMVSLTVPRRRRRPFPAPAPLRHAPITAPISVSMAVPGASALRIVVPRMIDWLDAAKQAAAAVLARKAKTVFGFPKGAQPFRALKGSSADSPPHKGESYRLDTGQEVLWVSRHCYLISNPPRLGETQIAGQPQQVPTLRCTHSGNPWARALSKRLRTYERYRRQLDLSEEDVARHRHPP